MRDYKWLPTIQVTISQIASDYEWIQEKDAGELSSLTFLLQGIKGCYGPEHSQNTSGYEPNYNSENK